MGFGFEGFRVSGLGAFEGFKVSGLLGPHKARLGRPLGHFMPSLMGHNRILFANVFQGL